MSIKCVVNKNEWIFFTTGMSKYSKFASCDVDYAEICNEQNITRLFNDDVAHIQLCKFLISVVSIVIRLINCNEKTLSRYSLLVI